jgi:hypothetical protein
MAIFSLANIISSTLRTGRRRPAYFGGDEDGSMVSECEETAGRGSIFISNVEGLWRYQVQERAG